MLQRDPSSSFLAQTFSPNLSTYYRGDQLQVDTETNASFLDAKAARNLRKEPWAIRLDLSKFFHRPEDFSSLSFFP